MDYEQLWHDEIAEQWISDFVLHERQYWEVSVTVTDPEVDPDTEEFNVKNVVFTIEADDETINIWVFYNAATEEIEECESLHNYDIDADKLAEEIFLINERWKAEKSLD
jgi:hypothetical protein